MGALKVQLVAFKRQNYTQNDVKMAILVTRVRTTGELGAPLNNTWAPLKTWFVKSNFFLKKFGGGGGGGGVSKNIDCYFDVQFQFCVLWSSWIIMCKIATTKIVN